jgi:hypothetical protein
MGEWEYWCLHIPSGQKFLKKTGEMGFRMFMAQLDMWNATQPGVWQYWSHVV